MTLKEWLEKIHQLHPRKWDLGLERVGSVGLRLNVLKPAERLFLVAGTNGKGSTCEFLSRLCHELGISYGTTTSPFLLDYNEQININGQPVDDAEIVSAFETIDEARRDISLTYFEFGALAALLIFSRHELDVAIVEVGLGGRLDAMNIVEPDLSIVTRVDIDHQEWLGIDRERIGREKAGILRAGRPGVFVDSDPPQSLFEEAEKLGVKTYCMGEDISFENDILTFKDQRYNLANCDSFHGSLLSITTKDLVFDSGRHSIIVTLSPSVAPTLAGLWALIFDELREYRSYLVSYFILLTWTTTVFWALALSTIPRRTCPRTGSVP